MGGAWSKPALTAAAVTSMIFAALLIAVVTDPRPRLAATNSRVLASGVALDLLPGQERCEDGQFVPAKTAVLRVYAGSESGEGEPLRLSIADADSGEIVARPHVDGGYPLGALDVPVDAPGGDIYNGEVCIENLGSDSMTFAGHRTALGAPVPSDGAPGSDVRVPPVGGPQDEDEEVRIDLFRPGEETLWALAPEVARRFSLFKPALAGPWLMWAVLTVALGAVTAAVLLASREPGARAELPPGEER